MEFGLPDRAHMMAQSMSHRNQHHLQEWPNFPELQTYQRLLPIVKHVLDVMLENDFIDSVQAVVLFLLNFRWPDGVDITQYMDPAAEMLLKGRILEALAHWVRAKTRDLDNWVQVSQASQTYLRDRIQACKMNVEQACYQTNPNEVLAEFLFTVVIELLGKDAACLGSILAGMLLHQSSRSELMMMLESPSVLLACMVRKLEEVQAKISKVVMEMYYDTGFLSYDDSKNLLMAFFQYYTVETTTGTLEVHESCVDNAFTDSQFRVNLIDSFGCLMKLLRHLEIICSTNGHDVALAVDFEGVKLCRHGELCLVQMTCSDDPTLVYVVDIHKLGNRAFTMETPTGMSMKMVLENSNIRKVWFDPRNDVDALYHQFGIMPRGIFDLQLAEVADRRNRGLNVHYVQGLYKCLTQCAELRNEQKLFAERINTLGKSLYEPQNGGTYEVFQDRPLNPVILVYAAHDSRYMLMLYQQYIQSIGPRWVQRVLEAGDQRGRWCMSREYVVPSSEAPDF